MKVTEKGIILKTTRYGDADLIVSVLTPLKGCLQLFARSALKSKKRFGGGVLEPTHYISFLYEDRRSKLGGESEINNLLEASLLQGFSGVRTSYEKVDFALWCLTVVHRIARLGGVEGNEVFDILGNTLRTLTETNDLSKLKVHFTVRLLAQQGVYDGHGISEEYLKTPLSQHALLRLEDATIADDSKNALDRLRSYLEQPL